MNRIEISTTETDNKISSTLGLLLLGQIATIGLLYYGAINFILN